MVVVGSWAKGLRDGQGGPHQTNNKLESFNSIGLGARALRFFSAGQPNRNALHRSVGLRPSAVSSWVSTENPAQRKFHAKLIRTAVPIQS